MKIAQINNTGGIGSILARQQRKEGYEVEVFVFDAPPPLNGKSIGNKSKPHVSWLVQITVPILFVNRSY
jgi:hypothetical protein